MPQTSYCKGPTCKAELRWVEVDSYDNGRPGKKRIPIDIVPDAEKGTVVVVGNDTGTIVGKTRKAELVANGHTTFYVRHHASCPDVALFRKSKAKAAAPANDDDAFRSPSW